MVKLRFADNYQVVHFTNEIGKYIIGGIASFMNELYDGHSAHTGFVHLYDPNVIYDIEVEKFPGDRDIVSISATEADRISALSFDIAVVHFYGLSALLDESILNNRTLVYVVHSVPTTEPYDPNEPFGENVDVRTLFEQFCMRADTIVCVSQTEAIKLVSLYPEFEDKIRVIYNGFRFEDRFDLPDQINEDRRVFGFIGRLDYRKGLLDCVKAFKNIEGELRIACGKDDPFHFHEVMLYRDGAQLTDKIKFYGWCQGARKASFFRSLDALIIPSLYEPFGYVVLEAINAGIPIICSNRGGIPEIVGEYSYQFDPYEEGSLEAAIRKFQQAPVEEVRGELSRLLARKCLFTSEKMRSSYEALFEERLAYV